MSARYVHPSEEAVLVALDRLSGHNFGRTGNVTEGNSLENLCYLPQMIERPDTWVTLRTGHIGNTFPCLEG